MDTQVRPATPAEIHDTKAQQFEDQAKRHRLAAAFLSEHPEFQEFLELLKAGIFQ